MFLPCVIVFLQEEEDNNFVKISMRSLIEGDTPQCFSRNMTVESQLPEASPSRDQQKGLKLG